MVKSIFPLTIDQVVVQRGKKRLLDELTTTFSDRGITVVMGPNGSGKTSLLKLVHGLNRPKSGKLNWNSDTLNPQLEQSFVFQHPVIMRRTVFENVVYPLRIAGKSKLEANNIAQSWIDKVGLNGFEKLEAARLSGGEQQKMAIARSLVTHPQLLILDEPTTNLDGRSTREIEAILMAERERGLRILMATHDVGQAKRMATDIRFLINGRLVEEGPAALFFVRPDTREARAFLRGDIVE